MKVRNHPRIRKNTNARMDECPQMHERDAVNEVEEEFVDLLSFLT
jgi:hypothetical protein